MSDDAVSPAIPSGSPGEPAAGALSDGGRPSKRSRVLRLVRELLLYLALAAVLSTVIGRLRAPELPEEAPPFTLRDLDGARVSLADFRGRKVVLNFWATWCAPCRVEIPAFSRFARNHPDIVVLGIAVDGEPDELARAARELGIDYRVLVGTPDVVRRYGASTVPTTVVVDEDGRVKNAHVGVMLDPQLWLATR